VSADPGHMGGYLKGLTEQEVLMTKSVDRNIVSFSRSLFTRADATIG
jgi:hypothetical protein